MRKPFLEAVFAENFNGAGIEKPSRFLILAGNTRIDTASLIWFFRFPFLEVVLIFLAALFMTALMLRNLQPLQYEPAAALSS